MREEVPDYERLQDETAAATGTDAGCLLELGTGTGETARRVLASNPAATLLGLDGADVTMQARVAWNMSTPCRTTQRPATGRSVRRRLLSVSRSTTSTGPARQACFGVSRPRSRQADGLCSGDVVVPEDPADVVTPIDGDYDTPSTVAEQLQWLTAAGLQPRLAWAHRDLAVLVGTARHPDPDTGSGRGLSERQPPVKPRISCAASSGTSSWRAVADALELDPIGVREPVLAKAHGGRRPRQEPVLRAPHDPDRARDVLGVEARSPRGAVLDHRARAARSPRCRAAGGRAARPGCARSSW